MRPRYASRTVYRSRLLSQRPLICIWCEREIGRDEATIDHLVPQFNGGGEVPENMAIACYGCNQERARITCWDASVGKANELKESWSTKLCARGHRMYQRLMKKKPDIDTIREKHQALWVKLFPGKPSPL